MKILLCHNHYLCSGGEDRVFFDESELLRGHRHEVIQFTVHNDHLGDLNPLSAMGKFLWNRETARQIRSIIRKRNPQIMHCTNIFPLLSPSIYAAAQDEGVPVIQSLHNYRLFCASASFNRNGTFCQRCLSTPMFPWRAPLHGCYQGSRMRSFAIFAMLSLHRMLGTWSHRVDRYIASTEISRTMFARHGIPEEKIAVKPNFVSGSPQQGDGLGDYVLFVGRLSQEKGIEELVESWKILSGAIPLKIIGNGPLVHTVRRFASEDSSIQYLGELPHEDVMPIMRNARFLVVPSKMSETFGIVIIEAYACGRPVISATPAVTNELVEDGVTGLQYPSGSPSVLAETIRSLWCAHQRCREMGRNARRAYENRFTAEQNYRILRQIYQDVLSLRSAARK